MHLQAKTSIRRPGGKRHRPLLPGRLRVCESGLGQAHGHGVLTTSQVCYTNNCLPFGSFCHGQIQWHLQLGVEKFYFYTLVSNYIRQQRQIGNLRSSTVKILDIAITMMPVIQRRKKICTSLLYKFRYQFPTRAWQPRISSNRSMKFFCTAFPTAVGSS